MIEFAQFAEVFQSGMTAAIVFGLWKLDRRLLEIELALRPQRGKGDQ